MKKSLFTDEQIVRLLQQAERGEVTVAALCKQHSISQNTFYRWRRQFGGLQDPGGQTPQGAGTRERPPQAASG